MSPLKITILLHIYSVIADYRDEQDPQHARSEAVREAFDWFIRQDLVEYAIDTTMWRAMAPSERTSQFKVTPKGEAMVEALCAVQIPVCKWVQPEAPTP